MKKEGLIAGLDIGSSKVCVVAGQVDESELDVIGIGKTASPGLQNGVIVNIEKTTQSIKEAVEEAELMAGQPISSVWVSITGTHLKSFDSKGMVPIKNNEVTKSDVKKVIEAAKAIAVPSDQEVIHVITRDFKVDEQDGIHDPLGMSGVRLEATVHVVTASKSAVQNLLKCIEKAGLQVRGVVLESLASSLAVLSDDEKKLGVALVDMGEGTSNTIMFSQGKVVFTSVLPLGGGHITNDMAVGLRTPQSNAEELKKKYGCALASLVSEEESVEVAGVGGRKERSVLRQYLCEVIEPRAEETLNFINNEIQKSGLSSLMGSGVVLTGGASQLDGIIELGEFVFDMPVRRGLPLKIGGLKEVVRSTEYAAAIGLIKYGFEKEGPQKVTVSKTEKWNHLLKRVKEFVNEAF